MASILQASKASKPSAPSKAAVESYLHKVYRLMADRAFAMHPGCMSAETGFDVQAAVSARRATATFRRTGSGDGVVRFRNDPHGVRIKWLLRPPGAPSSWQPSSATDGTLVFELPVPRNVHTNPTTAPMTFRFSSVQGTSKPQSSGTVSRLLYTFAERHVMGYPVSIEAFDRDDTSLFVARHPVLIPSSPHPLIIR